MKKTISLCFLLLMAFQSKSQNVTATTGGEGNVGSMNINYTAGEAFVATLENGNAVLTQGFHQPSLFVTAMEETLLPGTVKVFPNPTTAVLYVQFEDIELENITIALYDMTGRSITTSKVDTGIWQTDLSGLAAGYYLLIVTDLENHKSNSFKILKSN